MDYDAQGHQSTQPDINFTYSAIVNYSQHDAGCMDYDAPGISPHNQTLRKLKYNIYK